MLYRHRHFTIIELLFSIVIIAVLTAMLLPGFSDSRDRARFVRWLHFNKQCSTDPKCVINLNFQEGEGDILENSAKGHETEGFNASDYNGIIKGDYEWTYGRWRKGKKAIQFDGAGTYVEFDNIEGVDFTDSSNFTIMIWMKFDLLDKWDGMFGKCYMRNSVNGFPQYAVYYDGSHNNAHQVIGKFTAEIGENRVEYENLSESGVKLPELNNYDWLHLTLRHRVVNENEEIDLFLNGIKLKTNHVTVKGSTKYRSEARLAMGCIRWLLIKNNVPDCNGKPSNFFKGKIDEFLVYNRALSDSEIMAHYEMGAQHL